MCSEVGSVSNLGAIGRSGGDGWEGGCGSGEAGQWHLIVEGPECGAQGLFVLVGSSWDNAAGGGIVGSRGWLLVCRWGQTGSGEASEESDKKRTTAKEGHIWSGIEKMGRKDGRVTSPGAVASASASGLRMKLWRKAHGRVHVTACGLWTVDGGRTGQRRVVRLLAGGRAGIRRRPRLRHLWSLFRCN